MEKVTKVKRVRTGEQNDGYQRELHQHGKNTEHHVVENGTYTAGATFQIAADGAGAAFQVKAQ